MNKGKTNPFVDREGYQTFIALKERHFQNELIKQKAAS